MKIVTPKSEIGWTKDCKTYMNTDSCEDCIENKECDASSVRIQCEHKFVFQESRYKINPVIYGNEYFRRDIFYCEKCLETREKNYYEHSRAKPDWYINPRSQ